MSSAAFHGRLSSVNVTGAIPARPLELRDSATKAKSLFPQAGDLLNQIGSGAEGLQLMDESPQRERQSVDVFARWLPTLRDKH